MSERFDVVIVGARCAGAPLAALLAREGLNVAVVERAAFPKETLSSHVKQADALQFMDRLGVLDRVRRDTQAPFTTHVDARIEDFRAVAEVPRRPGDVGGGACIRRVMLDPILADAAAEAGADMRMATKVVDLVEEGGRIAGVRISGEGGDGELRAPLVVGADGRASTVAKWCGARKFNRVANERAYYWSYFEGADLSGDPTFVFHRWGDRFILGSPCDSGLYMVGTSPEADEGDDFKRDLESHFIEHALSCEPVAAALQGARRATKIFGILRFDGYFREATGPGWVLVGDSGHFKDPAAGRGIGDAFRQVETVAPAIVRGLDGSGGGLDRSLAVWARWRDREFAEHYWLGVDFGKAGAVPAPIPEMIRRLYAQGKAGTLIEVLSHRSRPFAVFNPARLLGATGRMLVRSPARRALLTDARGALVEEARRRWVNRHPVFDEPAGAGDGDALARSRDGGAPDSEDQAPALARETVRS